MGLVLFIAGLIVGMGVQSFREHTAPPRYDVWGD